MVQLSGSQKNLDHPPNSINLVPITVSPMQHKIRLLWERKRVRWQHWHTPLEAQFVRIILFIFNIIEDEVIIPQDKVFKFH